ncbi:hypothetical protein PMAYCL1PPCAC_12062 [Pristionchus mayeri]|uniref:Peptide-methionine (R)-S-oxide reductase n=1 Tax=Pristionchus mayeri TaxID=1317129 RepID=A0AAN5CFI3_9BILA|nr:hypothetical protein PMAYCL1PPCAC_12062 [Pristionchus mayeri]
MHIFVKSGMGNFVNTMRSAISSSVRSTSTMSGKPGMDDIGIKKLGVTDAKEVKDEDWKKVLDPQTYSVTRKADTEAPFTGAYDKFFEKGRYRCVCCGIELFNSDSKFWAGCGWPAFSNSVDNDLNIKRIVDNSHGMTRTEVRCKNCDAHLGHVFDDGPQDKGGERYCINSVSMVFEQM